MKKLQLLTVIFLLLSALTFAQTVYVTNTGKKYHKSSCSYLSKSKISISLEDAKSSGYTACKRCKPSSGTTYQKSKTKEKPETSSTIEKKKTTKIKPSSGTTYQKSETKEKTETSSTTEKKKITKSRCIAITKKGTQCKRNAQAGSSYCWQHK